MRSLLLWLFLIPSVLCASTAAPTVSQLFESLKQNPQALRMFLLQMPKGGELHYHWDGSTYPEDMADLIQPANFCYDPTTFGVAVDSKVCPGDKQLNQFSIKPALYQTLINNWSLTTNYDNRVETNQHFFQFFLGTEPIVAQYSGEMLASEMQRAADQSEDYMEMVYILDLPEMISLGSQIKFNSNFDVMNAAIKPADIDRLVNNINQATNHYYQTAHTVMQCGTAQAASGCQVKVRFIFSAMRNFPPSIVFTQLAIAFKAATENSLIVGVDLVGPENDYSASRDYTLQMQMVHYFHTLYPKVHIRLHAGELSLEEAPPNFMRDHIEQAINIAGAERIGHGVDIADEINGIKTIKEMASQHICVEQLLTSNEKLLNVAGPDHPLPLYLHYHVPVVLSTDDEGILRTTLTTEFYKAVLRYNLSYTQIKTMARNVLTYNFLPGESLWKNPDNFTAVSACRADRLGRNKPSAKCQAFLASSEKARLQWQLEEQLDQFEKGITSKMR